MLELGCENATVGTNGLITRYQTNYRPSATAKKLLLFLLLVIINHRRHIFMGDKTVTLFSRFISLL